MKELRIKAIIKNLHRVLEFIDAILIKEKCSPDLISQMDIAVEEIFVNVSSYAYSPKDGEITIRVEILRDTNEIQVTFKDDGVPFDPLKHQDPNVDIPIEDRPIGGLGVYMVKMSMDKVEYEYKDGSNVLSITKNIENSGE